MSEHCQDALQCRPEDLRCALSIHTQKITDSCRDKDCIEDLRVYLTRESQALLDQSFVAGIGNIYADEILSAIHLDPRTPAGNLSRKQLEEMIFQTRCILNRAIEAGGTTIRSYTSSLGVTGRFQLDLNVHGLDVCPFCSTAIKKIRVGGRGTYYCPKCQKKKR